METKMIGYYFGKPLYADDKEGIRVALENHKALLKREVDQKSEMFWRYAQDIIYLTKYI